MARPIPPHPPLWSPSPRAPRADRARALRLAIGAGSVVAAAVGGAFVLPACQHATNQDVDTAITTAARPESTVTTSRTIDNAGWVDPAGRTSDETLRSEMSGMRGTEVGSERITGTPGSGLSPTPSPAATEASNGESARGGSPTGPGTPLDVIAPRMASARCDHENHCGKVGKGKRWGSLDACRMSAKETSIAPLRVPACEASGVDAEALARCLTAERNRSCSDERPERGLPACQPQALCGGP